MIRGRSFTSSNWPIEIFLLFPNVFAPTEYLMISSISVSPKAICKVGRCQKQEQWVTGNFSQVRLRVMDWKLPLKLINVRTWKNQQMQPACTSNRLLKNSATGRQQQ